MNAVIQLRSGPSMNKGKSKQDYGTPTEFLEAVQDRFGKLHFDLAATAANAVTRSFFDPDRDSLKSDWSLCAGTLWLNPPFADIAPWARKCAATAREGDFGPRILMLTPASVGSNWFAEHVHRKAMVLALSPRLTFVGTTDPYPKDLMLSCFGFGVQGFDVWRWKK